MANTHTNIRGWTDLDDHSRFRNRAPNVIILADEIANGEWDGLVGDIFKGDTTRKCVYVDDDGERWYMELELYIHPTGAGALTILTAPTTSLCRGKFLGEDGDWTEDILDVIDIAGGMLSHYCETSSEVGSPTAQQPTWSTKINEGDAIWLVRRGRYFAETEANGDPSAANDKLTTGGVAGAVAEANAFSNPPTIAEVAQYTTGYGGKCIGYALEAEGITLNTYVDMILDLPHRYSIP